MDLVSIFAPLFGIAFVVERILESVFNVVENFPQVTAMKNSEDAAVKKRWSEIKQVLTIIIGFILGIVITNMLGITFFSQLRGIGEINPNTDMLISGALAGALAPYAHQILEALLNFQKLMNAQKEKIEKGNVIPPSGD